MDVICNMYVTLFVFKTLYAASVYLGGPNADMLLDLVGHFHWHHHTPRYGNTSLVAIEVWGPFINMG